MFGLSPTLIHWVREIESQDNWSSRKNAVIDSLMENISLLYGTCVCASKQITIKISFYRSEFVLFSYPLYKNAHRLPPDRRLIVRVRCIFHGDQLSVYRIGCCGGRWYWWRWNERARLIFDGSACEWWRRRRRLTVVQSIVRDWIWGGDAAGGPGGSLATQQCCRQLVVTSENKEEHYYTIAQVPRNRCAGASFFGDYTVHREGNLLIQFSEVFKLFFRVHYLWVGRVPLMNTILTIHSTFKYVPIRNNIIVFIFF